MDFEFNEEHSLFREQLRRFLSEQVGFGETRNLLDGNAVISELTWDGLVEMGITAISIPEEYGGLGLDPLFMCVAAEELGRVCASVPFSSSIYGAAEAINLFGSEAQKNVSRGANQIKGKLCLTHHCEISKTALLSRWLGAWSILTPVQFR